MSTDTVSAPIIFRDARDDPRIQRRIERLRHRRQLERAQRLQIGSTTFERVNTTTRRTISFNAVLSSLARLCRIGCRQKG
jgi:hypothetical protein